MDSYLRVLRGAYVAFESRRNVKGSRSMTETFSTSAAVNLANADALSGTLRSFPQGHHSLISQAVNLQMGHLSACFVFLHYISSSLLSDNSLLHGLMRRKIIQVEPKTSRDLSCMNHFLDSSHSAVHGLSRIQGFLMKRRP
jgi:hypothetical protein